MHNYSVAIANLDSALKRKKFNITIGDELPSGTLKLAKVFIAKK